MSAIRNTCVARAAHVTTGAHTVYTVPAGFVLILKSIRVQTDGGNPAVVSVFLLDPVSGTAVTIDAAATTSANLYGLDTWICLNGGDELNLSFSAATYSYWVSGALLPFTP